MFETIQRPKAFKTTLFFLAATALVVAAAPLKNGYYNDWDNTYPSSVSDDNVITGTGSSCQLCHRDDNGGDPFNAYGWEIWQAWDAGASIPTAILQVEALDSDGDGASNIFEIDVGTQPGWRPGNNNTIFFENGSTTANQAPPGGILGSMDPTCGTVVAYCTAGVSASGCQTSLSASGTASSSGSGTFTVTASNGEGDKLGIFFQGTTGRQANSWGNGASFQCVIPPVKRLGTQPQNGTAGSCDSSWSQELNAYWQANPTKNPGAGLVQLQFWYRDPQNTSNQTTSLSDALEFLVCP